MLAIIGAMDEEISQIKAIMEDVEITNKAGMKFYKGKILGKEIVAVRSGIGKVNAAVCTQILVDFYAPLGIINTGIAGSLQDFIDIGDIVLSDDVLHHDVDATGFGYPIGQIPRMAELSFKADNKLLKIAKIACEKVIKSSKSHIGRIVSGDQFISDKMVKSKIKDNFNAMCTEMEGAAIAQTAYLNNVPFLIIRAISDKADDSASMDYSEFEARAIENSVLLTLEMIAQGI